MQELGWSKGWGILISRTKWARPNFQASLHIGLPKPPGQRGSRLTTQCRSLSRWRRTHREHGLGRKSSSDCIHRLWNKEVHPKYPSLWTKQRIGFAVYSLMSGLWSKDNKANLNLIEHKQDSSQLKYFLLSKSSHRFWLPNKQQEFEDSNEQNEEKCSEICARNQIALNKNYYFIFEFLEVMLCFSLPNLLPRIE